MHTRFMHLLFGAAIINFSGCGETRAVNTDNDPPSPKPEESVKVWRYFDGKSWQLVEPMLDRMQVERRRGDDILTEVIMLRQGVPTAAHLDDVARQMRAAQPTIVRITGFIRFQSDGSSRQCPHRVMVRSRGGLDIKQLIQAAQGRIVETVSTDPVVTIVEPTSDSLFAVFPFIERLQAVEGIQSAEPLFSRRRFGR